MAKKPPVITEVSTFHVPQQEKNSGHYATSAPVCIGCHKEAGLLLPLADRCQSGHFMHPPIKWVTCGSDRLKSYTPLWSIFIFQTGSEQSQAFLSMFIIKLSLA